MDGIWLNDTMVLEGSDSRENDRVVAVRTVPEVFVCWYTRGIPTNKYYLKIRVH